MAPQRSTAGMPLPAFFRNLSTRQKTLLGAAALGSLALFVGLVTIVNRPTYGTLFSNVDAQDAAKIVERLKERKISYVLEDAGRTILVPKDQVYELRLLLSGEGLPQSSTVGFEIFDRTNLGLSDFVQKVNYRRALEGELARTIARLEEVEAARVHIVVPQQALFKEDEKPATASVILKLRSRSLSREVVQSIVHLVSSSVEGLEPNRVTVVDMRGRLLSAPEPSNPVAALSGSQYELQQKVEQHLAQKAQRMLDGVLGPGNAIVQVNVEMDFRQVERTLEQYDAENPVVRSEQITEEKTSTKDVPTPSTRTNSITNYEINKTVERIAEGVGGIKRLSVAAMINGKVRAAANGEEKNAEYIPRSQDEIDRLTEVIKKAVGFDPRRNDEVAVINMPFGETIESETIEPTPLSRLLEHLDTIILLIAIIVAMLVVRSLLHRLKSSGTHPLNVVLGNPPVGDLTQPRQVDQLPSPEEEIPAEVLLRSERRKKIAEYIEEQPEKAAKLIQVWLAND